LFPSVPIPKFAKPLRPCANFGFAALVLIFAIRCAQITGGCDVKGIGMTGRAGTTALSASATIASVAIAALLAIGAGLAQDASAPSEGASGAAQHPIDRPGFIESLGQWLEQGATRLKSDLQGTREKLDQLGSRARGAAKDATGALMGLPNARVVSGRERCLVAQNGAPDCQTAAAALCRGKGFATGKSLDTQSEQKCPAQVLLSGRAPNNTECPTEIFVTRAVCQ
jgi:hypothetical protein